MANDMNKNLPSSDLNGNEIEAFLYLEGKVNVDRAAILEAIEQVGKDPQKVELYLINTRGL